MRSKRFNKFITPKNDRIWRVDAPSSSAFVEQRQHSESVMVLGGICTSGETPLIYMEEGVKIVQKVYQSDIIEAAVLTWYQRHFRNAKWKLQQDSAQFCKAKNT
ncbi:DDE_3 domain-containing protein [Trichonephila clavipes]|nr:DDE_3 domain-containing protein [Trichonephila clavipes]